MDTLESSFWCLLNTHYYTEAVLVAVNLGYDTDTTAAATGGMVGMYYGIDTAPKVWYDSVLRIQDIEKLCNKLALFMFMYKCGRQKNSVWINDKGMTGNMLARRIMKQVKASHLTKIG